MNSATFTGGSPDFTYLAPKVLIKIILYATLLKYYPPYYHIIINSLR